MEDLGVYSGDYGTMVHGSKLSQRHGGGVDFCRLLRMFPSSAHRTLVASRDKRLSAVRPQRCPDVVRVTGSAHLLAQRFIETSLR